MNANVSKRFGKIISCAHDVSHLQACSHLHVYPGCAVRRIAVVGIGTKSDVACIMKALLIFLTVIFCDRCDRVRLGLNGFWVYRKTTVRSRGALPLRTW